MSQAWIEDLKRAVYIAEKDIKIYFLKGPNLIFGLLLPISLFKHIFGGIGIPAPQFGGIFDVDRTIADHRIYRGV